MISLDFVFNERIIETTSSFHGLSAKNDSLLQIEEIVRIYANSRYLVRNVQWVLLVRLSINTSRKVIYIYIERERERERETHTHIYIYLNPFPKPQILDSSKLKEFADDNFKLDENGGKLSKRVENTVGKGEIARYEQFLPFPQCFQMTCTADT